MTNHHMPISKTLPVYDQDYLEGQCSAVETMSEKSGLLPVFGEGPRLQDLEESRAVANLMCLDGQWNRQEITEPVNLQVSLPNLLTLLTKTIVNQP